MGIVSLLLLSSASAAYAVQVTLAWDPPATGTLDGYRVFYRLQDESYDYSNPALGAAPRRLCSGRPKTRSVSMSLLPEDLLHFLDAATTAAAQKRSRLANFFATLGFTVSSVRHHQRGPTRMGGAAGGMSLSIVSDEEGDRLRTREAGNFMFLLSNERLEQAWEFGR
jgi:hypothetical protein